MHKLLRIITFISFLIPVVFTSLHAEKKPNILVFLVDDMGLMDSSLPFLKNGKGESQKHPLNDFYRTPNMERLAKQGTRFSQFYAMSVCSPTRISIMTGQTSARHKSTQWIRSEGKNTGDFGPPNWKWEGPHKEDVFLAKLLQNNGYRTIHSGKAHFGPLGYISEFPDKIGFDVNIGGCSWGQPGSYYGKKNFGHGIKRRQRRAVPGMKQYHGKDIYLTEASTIEMNKAITQAVSEKKPFFAYMSHYAVHAPFEPDPRFIKNYKHEKKGANNYASMIEGMDKSLGDILDHLNKLGVAEDTLVFFLGDNGGDAPLGGIHDIASSAPLRGKKGTHYEGGMRIPFIAAWAKVNQNNSFQKETPIHVNHHSEQMGSVCDLFPTIVKVTQTNVSKDHIVDGQDLSGYIKKGSQLKERDFLMHFPHSHRSSYYTVYRKGDWKLIWHYRNQNNKRWKQAELFNLKTDPYESNNLSDKNPDKLKEMLSEMKAKLDDCNAQYPLRDDKKTSFFLKP